MVRVICMIGMKVIQRPRRDSGSAGAKNVLDALENDTKLNFEENIPGKYDFRKGWGACPPWPPLSRGACYMVCLPLINPFYSSHEIYTTYCKLPQFTFNRK